MAKRSDPIMEYPNGGYSSTVRKVYEVDNFGKGASLQKNVTMVASTTGAIAEHTLCTVTGTVAMSIFARCTTDFVSSGSGTISVGTTLTVAGLIALTTGTDLDVNDIWHDAAPDKSVELTSILLDNVVSDDVIYKILTGTISAGVLEFYIRWAPISTDGKVVLA